MRIAQVSPLYERVPPRRYGGTERVVAHLCDELMRRGHAVTLFASGDSCTQAELVAMTPRALRLDPETRDPIAAHVPALPRVFERAAVFDVIHCHVDYLAFPYTRLVRTPTEHTLHGRLDLPSLPPLFRHFHGIPMVSISDAQRRPLDGLGVRWTATIHHGLPLAEYPPAQHRCTGVRSPVVPRPRIPPVQGRRATTPA